MPRIRKPRSDAPGDMAGAPIIACSAPVLFVCLGLLVGGGSTASAQAANETPSQAPWRLHDAADLPGWLSLSGSIRPRYETLENQFVAGRTGSDELFSVQSLLKAEIHSGNFAVGAELLDARKITGNSGGAAAGEIDTFEPLQAYVAWRPIGVLAADATTDVALGRFTLDLGSRRLISRSGYRNLQQDYDGVRAEWSRPDGRAATLFYTSPVGREPTDAASALDNDAEINREMRKTHFYGANIAAPIGHAVMGEVYAYKLEEDDEPHFATRNRNLLTAGAWLKRAPKSQAFDFEVEYAHQTGHARATSSAADTTDLDHTADVVHAEAGYTLKAHWSPRISLHYDFASGDKSPADANDQRFDPLFGDRSFEFGPTSIYALIARTNMSSPGVRLELKPDKRTTLMAMVRQLRLAEARDSLANTSVRDASGASGKDAGTQLELQVHHWLVPSNLRLDLGAIYFSEGDFLKRAPNATREGDPLYGYSSLTWSF